jgi:hypothetical protein
MQTKQLCSVAGWALVVTALMLPAACATATAPSGTPTVERWNPPSVGSTWVSAYKNSGSYGSAPSQSTIQFLGEQDFQGKKLLGVQHR